MCATGSVMMRRRKARSRGQELLGGGDWRGKGKEKKAGRWIDRGNSIGDDLYTNWEGKWEWKRRGIIVPESTWLHEKKRQEH